VNRDVLAFLHGRREAIQKRNRFRVREAARGEHGAAGERSHPSRPETPNVAAGEIRRMDVLNVIVIMPCDPEFAWVGPALAARRSATIPAVTPAALRRTIRRRLLASKRNLPQTT
jgi:hypothetical protein